MHTKIFTEGKHIYLPLGGEGTASYETYEPGTKGKLIAPRNHMIDSDAVVNAAPNGRIFASFWHEPEARGIRRPPPVYLTLNKLSYLILSYLLFQFQMTNVKETVISEFKMDFKKSRLSFSLHSTYI